MLESMPLVNFYEWMEHHRRNPFGEERADLRCAIIAAAVANASKGKRGRKYKPKDFMPKFGKNRKRVQTAKEIKDKLFEIARVHNAQLALSKKKVKK